MSKKMRIGLALGLVAITGLASWWWLRPREKESMVEREISIQEAQIDRGNLKKYNDPAGFNFDYYDSLSVTPLELDDKSVYASLELAGSDGQKMTLRIFDDSFDNSDDWLDHFEKTYVVLNLENLLWVDLSAKRFFYDAPQKLVTVAAENGVTYLVESSAETNYWMEQHKQLVDSFKFDESVYQQKGQTNPETSDEDITLIEERLEE